MKKVEQFMKWISMVHGDDILNKVKQKAGDDASLEKLSATLDDVLLQKHSEANETELSSDSDQLTFDNDLMIL